MSVFLTKDSLRVATQASVTLIDSGDFEPASRLSTSLTKFWNFNRENDVESTSDVRPIVEQPIIYQLHAGDATSTNQVLCTAQNTFGGSLSLHSSLLRRKWRNGKGKGKANVAPAGTLSRPFPVITNPIAVVACSGTSRTRLETAAGLMQRGELTLKGSASSHLTLCGIVLEDRRSRVVITLSGNATLVLRECTLAHVTIKMTGKAHLVLDSMPKYMDYTFGPNTQVSTTRTILRSLVATCASGTTGIYREDDHKTSTLTLVPNEASAPTPAPRGQKRPREPSARVDTQRKKRRGSCARWFFPL